MSDPQHFARGGRRPEPTGIAAIFHRLNVDREVGTFARDLDGLVKKIEQEIDAKTAMTSGDEGSFSKADVKSMLAEARRLLDRCNAEPTEDALADLTAHLAHTWHRMKSDAPGARPFVKNRRVDGDTPLFTGMTVSHVTRK